MVDVDRVEHFQAQSVENGDVVGRELVCDDCKGVVGLASRSEYIGCPQVIVFEEDGNVMGLSVTARQGVVFGSETVEGVFCR